MKPRSRSISRFSRAWLDRYAFDATSYAGESKRGERLLVSDHPEWWPAACPDDAEIVGEAAWTVRTLVNRR